MEKFRVLVADKMSSKVEEVFRRSQVIEVDVKTGLDPKELVKIIGDYHGLAVRSATKVTAEILEAATKLKVIGRAGVGVDNIDVEAATRRGILVENTPGGNAVTTAELAIGLMMSLARFIPQATASMKAGQWEKKLYEGTELCDKTLGVLGFGSIGKIVADRALGLKMKVIAHDPFAKAEQAKAMGVELVGLDEFCKRVDFISVHTVLTPETKGLIGRDAIANMKPTVRIINAARGGVVDEAALLEALNAGKVLGAALDVFETEPTPKEHALVMHERVICTPHLGASSAEAQVKVAIEVAEQITAFAERGEIRNAVNGAALGKS